MNLALNLKRLALALLGLSVLASCASAPSSQQTPPPAQLSKMPIQEQEKHSLEKYSEVLDMIANVPAHEVAAQLNEKYKEIIKDYPDSYYAEESYFRLIKSSIRDPWPPDFDTAERYYAEYSKNYPKPRMIVVMNDFMVRTYDEYKQWDRLIAFLQPYIKRYVQTGNAEPVHFMYYYSEAKAGKNEFEEARRGFQTVINLFPDSAEAKFASKRLVDLDKAEKAMEGDKK